MRLPRGLIFISYACWRLTRGSRGNASGASGFGGVAAFLDSLKTGTPPAAAVPLLRAVWHGLRGDWEAAHHIAQDDASAEGAWVHAWLHRIEGDVANAGYWYRRAHRNAAEGDPREEGETIAAFLLKR